MSRQHAGLAHALRELAEQVPEWLEHQLPAVLEELFRAVVVPVCAGLLVAAVAGIALTRLKRLAFPPGAAELHQEALQALLLSQPSSSPSPFLLQKSASTTTTPKAERQAEQLLWRALEKDPSYEPAVLSLAALYVYRQRNGQKAARLLRNVTGDVVPNSKNPSSSNSSKSDVGGTTNPLVAGLLLDARAVEAGQFQMVQAELREAEFLQPPFASRQALLYDDDGKKEAAAATAKHDSHPKASGSSKEKEN